jgi:hypothetical protein
VGVWGRGGQFKMLKYKLQGVTKRCRLSWLTNSAQMRWEGGSCGVSANELAVHRSPNKFHKPMGSCIGQ